MITAKELTELVLKFEELKEKYNLNYVIYTTVTMNNGEIYLQEYNIQSLTQFGELLHDMDTSRLGSYYKSYNISYW